jgi:DNA segregation ATPase FtsK/SpoIIIE-like protein
MSYADRYPNWLTREEEDQLYRRVCEYVTRTGSVRLTDLQRTFGVGFYKAYGWVERMEQNGVITPPKNRLH